MAVRLSDLIRARSGVDRSAGALRRRRSATVVYVEISAAHCVESGGPSGTTRCVTCSPILLHSSMSQVATYLKGWSTLRFNKFETETLRSGLFNRRLASARDFSMSGQ
jgi:hypothetical protein